MKMIMLAVPALLIAAPATAQVMAPTEYVTTAGASDLYEITSSQLVLQSTTDPKIRQFAQMMVAHHTKSTADVKAAAAKSRVDAPPPALNPLQTELVTELQSENGPARDAAYIAQQKLSHQQALNVQKAYATDGSAAPLKAAAKKIVPVVQSHIAMLMKM
jgi:putative membrane protein